MLIIDMIRFFAISLEGDEKNSMFITNSDRLFVLKDRFPYRTLFYYARDNDPRPIHGDFILKQKVYDGEIIVGNSYTVFVWMMSSKA
jgi:hypothetical protein